MGVLVGLGLAGSALARPVAIGGLMQPSSLDSRLIAGQEMMAAWTLPRLGVAVRNDPADLRLQLGQRELRYAPATGWRALGFALGVPLPLPQLQGGSLYVPLEALRLLGVGVLADTPGLLDFAAPTSVPVATLPPSAPPSAPARPAQSVPAPSAPVRPVPVQPAPGQPAPGQPAPAVPTQQAPTQTPPTQPPPTQPAPPPAPVEIRPVSPPAPAAPPSPMQTGIPLPVPQLSTRALAHLDTVRVSRTLYRTVEVQRVVLEFNDIAPYSVSRQSAGLSILMPGVTSQPQTQTLPSGDSLDIQTTPTGSALNLTTSGGRSTVFTLDEPYRIVVDTVTYTDDRVPPPVNPDAIPEGVTYQQRGALHVLSFDPARFRPRVISAPLGRASDVGELVRSVGGVAGVNGGYFDPASNLPVDLVELSGQMTSGSLEKRGTVGFTAQGEPLFGYPRPRYVLSGAFGSVTVNSVRARPDAALLTAFVGDGRTSVGAGNLTTVLVAPGAAVIERAQSGELVPGAGVLAFTFDPVRFPALPRLAGLPLSVSLNWQASDAPWASAVEALGAGPLLVQGGRVVLDPVREGFNTAAGIWRATRQVAFGILSGQSAIFFLEHGTPETFAAALAGIGVRDAVRLDSGSSATAYLSGGYGGMGGYLNTVWSRPVPNAIVFVPRSADAQKAQPQKSSK
ncbi:hypothetical protein CVO96_02840 [Deinococcus koreensis]|uniref:Phosphodiester glycosidase domain-containing protein n=2 Tax=Deinococcus koreensis TaxID=2054903 RepID=A0A2K3UV77_9DEIO|nr:hypothetical protein CVO96_02840 [Deinococcus koreensis]